MRYPKVLALTGAALLLTCPALAADWPEIPDSDWQLTAVAGHPNATAVILLDRGRLVLDADSLSSYLEVYRRIKILTDDGVEHGSASVFSSNAYRVKELKARTHRPDRTIVKLPDDAVFDKQYSRYYRRSVTSFAMPEVTAGTIVEYRYKIYFDSVLYPSPWYFQAELPVLLSEFEFILPTAFSFKSHAIRTLRNKELEQESHKDAFGLTAVFRMRDMPPVPDEPMRFPFDTLASRIIMLPQAYQGSVRTPLLETWKSAVSLVLGTTDYGYRRFMKRDSGVGGAVKEATAGATGPRPKAEALYRFVRDDIITENYHGVGIGESTAAKVISKGRGAYAEKALLLHHMLKKAGIDSTLCWTAPRDSLLIDTKVPNLGQFEQALVVVEVDGEQTFLDSSDRSLAFGLLPPALEGVSCLLVDRRPEWTKTPTTTPEDSRRHVTLALELDADGRLQGTGAIDLAGHQAWRRLLWTDSREETLEGWGDWLVRRFTGYDITDLEVEENIEERSVHVSWTLTQRDEDVLGDEATFKPSAPLAIKSNPYSLPANRRLTPAQLDFPWIDTVELTLSWPQGWILEGTDREHQATTNAGRYVLTSKLDPDARTLNTTRTFTITRRDFVGGEAYAHLRRLYEDAAHHDATELLLVAE